MSAPLSNNTNTSYLKQQPQQHTWAKPDVLNPRLNNLREQDLQQKLKQASLRDNSENAKPTSQLNISQAELTIRKKKFASFRFYLDNLDASATQRIERGIKLLGATHEPFFSKKCTHFITTKPIPFYENMLQSSDPSSNNAKNTRKSSQDNSGPKDSAVENAIQWGIVLWSADVMLKTVDFFLKANCGRKQLQEKRGLGKALQEEKLFGPSTGANSEAQSKRPQFIPFTGHYLIVEDATQMHRPPVCKQWTKQVFTKKPDEYPWPYFKPTARTRSPFAKKPSSAPPPPKKPGNIEEQEDKENAPKDLIPNTPANVTPISLQQKQQLLLQQKHPDSLQFSLRASGIQPSCTNNIQSASTTRSVTTTSASIMQGDNRRLPPGESVSRLDRRMVENITQKEQHQQHKLKIEKEQQRARQEREQKKKKDARYCENCNVLFENLEEHIKEQTHQTFIRDQNNFRELDELLAKTHRVYKQPLPDHMKKLVDPAIDGKNVQFVSDLKRSHPTPSPLHTPPSKLSSAMMQQKRSGLEPRIATSTGADIDENKGWGQYHDVFH